MDVSASKMFTHGALLDINSLLIHVIFIDFMNKSISIIFNPPANGGSLTTSLLILSGLLDHKKLYNILLIFESR